MVWWLWMVVGLVLLVGEMVIPGGLFALFFGLSALGVGFLSALGWAGPPWVQWLLFSGFSVLSLVILRGPLRGKLANGVARRPVDSLVGNSATVLENIAPGGVGRVEVRGAPWTARSDEERALPNGSRCLVERVEGLTLWVRVE